MESRIVPFVPHIYPVFMKVLQDEDSEVRGNCTYALGVLAEFGGESIYAYPLLRREKGAGVLYIPPPGV